MTLKKYGKLIGIAVGAAVLTFLVGYVAKNYWGSAYAEIPEDAAEWHEPENEEVRAKVEEITERILSGGNYGFEDILYVMDNDSAAGQRVQEYLIAQGKEALEEKAAEE